MTLEDYERDCPMITGEYILTPHYDIEMSLIVMCSLYYILLIFILLATNHSFRLMNDMRLIVGATQQKQILAAF